MNLCSMLIPHVRERPSQPAIVQTVEGQDTRITFAELDARSAKAASLLQHAGLGRSSRVLLLIPMSIELYVALIGVLRLGAVVTLLDPSAGISHIDRCCRLAKPAAMIGSGKAHLLRVLSAGLRAIPHKFALGPRLLPAQSWRRVDDSQPLEPLAEVDPDHPALLTFTSGSTGQPKAAVRSHGLLLAQQLALAEAMSLESGQADLTTLPVFTLSNLAAGVTSLLPDADLRLPGAINPLPVLAQIDRFSPASVVASPALLMQLTSHCENAQRTMPSFRRIFTGGAPVFWHQLDALARRLRQFMTTRGIRRRG